MTAFPGDAFLSEEKGMTGSDSARVWMIDPLDGTKDFKNGGNGFSVMIGLCEYGKPVLGVVYAPAKKILYSGEKGKGSYVRIDNKTIKLKVSDTSNIHESIMVTRIAAGERREEDKLEELFSVKEKLPESSVGIKLGLIASNKAEFHVNLNFLANKWDTCAPQIILEEAGGKVTDFDGNSLDYSQKENRWLKSFVASNGVLHKKILNELKKFNHK